jgi:hypothetical protein
MKIETIVEIAEDRLFSDLCLKWYLLDCKEIPLESDEEIKKQIYDEIIKLYNKINNK